jgi:glycosyltransferase involved in cell wall biosynthesis
MELASVIIPTFNSEKHIGESIDSVLTQNYPHIEIIVVDDGSSDGTVAMVRQKLQGFANWQVIELGINGGASAARNAGLRAASGSWVQFLDSDDILMPGKIARQMAVCAEAPADVAAIYSPWNWAFLEDGRIEWLGPLQTPSIAGKAPVMCLVGGCRPLLGANMMRRTVLNAVGGFDETLRFWECEEINVRIAALGSFLPAPATEPQYLWRLRRGDIYIGEGNARYKSKDVALGWITQAFKASGGRDIYDQGLSQQDRDMFFHECTLWGRLVYSQQKESFAEYLVIARKLDPNIAPAYPRYITALSRWVGYEKAEAVAKLTRQPKVWLRTLLNRLNLRRPNVIIELR